ncbi:uncharacterized protein LOC133845570 [Drosophila sulfurigaster albostrigata]|uniref:uncharacterized protein LOC133845570 n=1 Tax=Drosophila sulfurigaster albostrigata TaxID=89887 RepID=UPI002D21C478|nr:uncharacterized protein LOC133845570 [Drosophila sulfurigaster albostrigata]
MDKVFRLLLWITIFFLMARGKFKTLNCQLYDPKLGNFSKCEIKAVSRTKNIINVNFDIFNTIRAATIEVGIFKRENGWHPYLYSFSIDACKFIKKPYNVVAILGFEYIKPYSNLNHTCPYMAGTSLIVKGFQVDIDQFRVRFPVPNGEYGLRLSIFRNKILKATINGSVYYFDYKNQ